MLPQPAPSGKALQPDVLFTGTGQAGRAVYHDELVVQRNQQFALHTRSPDTRQGSSGARPLCVVGRVEPAQSSILATMYVDSAQRREQV